ncbi:MAG TPA: endonuclease [Flavobacteriaceae bacterium]|nr:endonuclease [Flavobacteriaceae bacterium]
MKIKLLVLFLLTGISSWAQIPSNYYNSANGLTGYALKTELHNIISNGHNPQSYDDLWTAFQTTDDDQYYENNGKVLDIYSENPVGNDPYEFTFINDECGNYNSEADCYNREHLMPQSWFNENAPMVTDIHHIYPTDGYVNGMRGHLPFGEVGSANFTSQNGSKRGNNILSGYNGMVFEPIDEFKGDVARVYFYMATRYEDIIGSWENANDGSMPTFDGSSDHVFEDWMLQMLLDWHNTDPASQKEIDRNNDAYDYQGNANPFISNPEYANMIWDENWGTTSQKNTIFEIFPNPVSANILNVQFLSNRKVTIYIYDLLGKKILEKNSTETNIQLNIGNLKSGVYLVKVSNENSVQIKKLIRK